MRNCARPWAGTSDIEAWGTLDGGASNVSVVKVGLFGYDITCMAIFCAIAGTEVYNCPIIEARGLDGLAFGIKFEIDVAATAAGAYYCAGFHREEHSDIAACQTVTNNNMNYYWS